MDIMTDVSFGEIVAFGIAAAVIFTGTITIFFIAKGGFQMIFSSNGENAEEEKNKAWGTIRHAILGLFIVGFAVVAVHFFGNVIGADFLRYLDSEQIAQMFDLITKKLGGDYSNPENGVSGDLDF